MQPIFRDQDLQLQFDRDGYVLVPWIGAEEIDRLRNLYASIDLPHPEGFHSTSFLSDVDVKRKINDVVEGVFKERVDITFSDIKKLGSSFLTKPVGDTGEMPVHQDWTIVDETRYRSVTIWVALEDVTEHNGAMQVLPGSHHFSSTLRAPTLPTDYAHLQDYLRSKMRTISLQAGEAIIFDHAIFHASFANRSEQSRLAVTYGLIPAEAQLSLFIQSGPGVVEQFEMPDDMFLFYNEIGTRPKIGKKIGERTFQPKPKSSLYFEQKINQYNAQVKGQRIFRSAEVQSSFDENGYAVLPALDQSEVATLLDFYNSLQLKDDAGSGFHISMDQTDRALVKRILDKLFEVALPKIKAHFEDAKSFVGSFVIKEPNPMSIVPVHQDWSFVEDEERYCSLTCWIPLVDTTLDNGAMAVIKGSHRFFKNFRPSPSPQVPSPLSEHMFTIFPYLQLIEMKAGQVLIFDNRTFHGSPPNTTTNARVGFGIGMTQKEAKLVHYYLDPAVPEKNQVLKYAIDEGFFLKYNNSKLSKMYDKGEMIEGYDLESTVPFDLPRFTSDELIELIKENGNQFNTEMSEKLARIFNYKTDSDTKSDEQKEVVVSEQEQERPEAEQGPMEWIDNRSFMEKYTPKNILIEIKKRLTSNV